MKNQEIMKQLMSNITENQEKIASLKNSNILKKEAILKKINPIIFLMNSIEKEVIEERKEEIENFYLSSSIKPIGGNYFFYIRSEDISSLSITNKFVKIRVDKFDRCGDKYYTRYKIPVKYLDMHRDDIIETHKEWSKNKIDQVLDKAKESIVKNKKKQISLLEKQLETLKNKK